MGRVTESDPFRFQDDLFEGNETKEKMFEQTPTAHMREMLSSHTKLASVCHPSIEFETIVDSW